MNPRFSVIIAVYNGAATIRRAIESVLVQTYPAHELIVVDDGSTDDTPDEVARFGERVHYIRQTNQGVSEARNRGAATASGDWLAFLDADDYYYLDRLRWHAELIRENSGLDFLTGDFEYRWPDGTLIRRSMESTAVGRRLLERANGADSIHMVGEDIGDFVEQHFGDTHTLSVPRAIFLELGGYPRGFQVCEDVHLLIRLCARSRCVGVTLKPLAVYTIHAHSATRRAPLCAQRQTLRALLALRAELEETPKHIRDGWLRSLRRARLDLASVLLRGNQRFEAVRAILPVLGERPGWQAVRDVLSVAKG